VPEEQRHHRFARAAGKATRAFMDASAADRGDHPSRPGGAAPEKAREQALREQPARDRPAGDRTPQDAVGAAVGTPVPMKVARWWWAVVTVVLALLTASFILSGLSMPEASPAGDPLGGSTGQFVLAGAAGVLTVATGVGAVQLLRSRRGAVGLLTGVAVFVGVPLIVRGHPLMITLAAVLLAGAALLWLPAVRRRLT
jgi:hypothetical protein